MSGNPFFDFNIDALSFLERAKINLSKFDNERNVGCLLNAALDLRMGIESRLYEIIDSVCQESGQKPGTREQEFAASKLLRELLSISPEAAESCQLSISLQPSGTPSTFQYTPATKKLASMHGRLGALLHYPVFRNTEAWYLHSPSTQERPFSLFKHRDFLGEVCEELYRCSCGDLLRPVRFRKL